MKKKGYRFFVILLLDLAVIVAVITFIAERYYSNPHLNIHGIYIDNPKEISAFHFTDHHNHPFTEVQLKGRWTLLFFGFTTCEKVCPTTMATLNKTYELLQRKMPANLLPQVVFVSVDPEQDTLVKLNNFVNSFNPRFLGIKADLNETLAFEKQLAITTQKINNTINHSAEILLINPLGRAQVYFPYPAEVIQLANDYELITRNWRRQ